MDTGEYLATQNLFILIGVALIAVVSLLLFLRKRSNRKPMENAPDAAITHEQAERMGHPR